MRPSRNASSRTEEERNQRKKLKKKSLRVTMLGNYLTYCFLC